MEKRKKWELPHWVTPGVFSGHYVAEEAVERVSIAKPIEITVPLPLAAEKNGELEALRQQVKKLEEEMQELKGMVASWEKRCQEMEQEQDKERQHLYQVVLALKKEWEQERDEHRDH